MCEFPLNCPCSLTLKARATISLFCWVDVKSEFIIAHSFAPILMVDILLDRTYLWEQQLPNNGSNSKLLIPSPMALYKTGMIWVIYGDHTFYIVLKVSCFELLNFWVSTPWPIVSTSFHCAMLMNLSISVLSSPWCLTALVVFSLLIVQVDPSECKILLTDPPSNSTKNREKMVRQFYFRPCVYLKRLGFLWVRLCSCTRAIVPFFAGHLARSLFDMNGVVIWQIETMFEKYSFGAVFI